MSRQTMRALLAALTLTAAFVGVTEASAKGWPGKGGGGKGFHHPHFGGHWGHGHGRYFRGGRRFYAYSGYGDCRLKRYINPWGEMVVRKICF